MDINLDGDKNIGVSNNLLTEDNELRNLPNTSFEPYHDLKTRKTEDRGSLIKPPHNTNEMLFPDESEFNGSMNSDSIALRNQIINENENQLLN